MPIETSPIPFTRLQLPYTPLSDPTGHPEIAPNGSIIGGGGGPPMGMAYPGMGSVLQPPINHGPASVAASAIIGPTPGGVASPHRPIPALPDAGYTAPTFRAASLTSQAFPGLGAGLHRGPFMPGGEGSVYAGGSMYGPHQHSPLLHSPDRSGHHAPGPYPGSPYSDGFSASLPAPRPAPLASHRGDRPHLHHGSTTPPYPPEERGRRPDRSPSASRAPTYPHHHHHHHQQPRAEGDVDDGASDASYYAKPRQVSHQHRSSSQGSSATDMSSPETNKRGGPTVVRQQSGGRHRSSSFSSADHDHSPVASSPLRAAERQPRSRRSSMGGDEGLGLAGLEVKDGREGRSRKASFTPPAHPGSGSEDDEQRGPRTRSGETNHRSGRPVMQHRKSNLHRVDGSLSDSEQSSERRRSVRERSASRLGRRSKDDADVDEGDGGENPRRPPRSSPDKLKVEEGVGRVRRVASVRGHRAGHEKENRGVEESPYHRPRLPIDDSPFLSPHSAQEYAPSEGAESRSRRHSHDHRHHFSEHHHHPQQYAQDDLPSQQKLRRGNSDASRHYPQQREYAPPPLAGTMYPHQSASAYGGAYAHSPHPQGQAEAYAADYEADGSPGIRPIPQMGMPGPGLDDYPSASRGMTMADAQMGGRVSQYGLPKYAHNPKVDYRRFCVQRGKADVFIT